MIFSYYCPKCQHIRQFLVEDVAPTRCRRQIWIETDQRAEVRVCDGELLPIRNLNHIIVREQP